MGFALVFFTNYAFLMRLPTIMWLILLGLGISQWIATTKLSIKSTCFSGIVF